MKWIFHIVMFGVTCYVAVIAYYWGDRTPPSFIIAMWVIPDELEPGQPFTAREIFVRNRLCMRFITHTFRQVQGSGGSSSETFYSTQSPSPTLFPTRYGLMAQNFDGMVPLSIKPGPAEYIMQLTWICLHNPVTWFNPIDVTRRYGVKIVPPALYDEGFYLRRGNGEFVRLNNYLVLH